jgi:hypothetical protein
VLAVARQTGFEDVRYRVGGDNALLRLVIFQQWRERCYWCDEPKIYHDIQLDHIIAHTVSRNALDKLITQHGLPSDFDVHSAANLAPICGRCNREKSDGTFTGTLLSGKLEKASSKSGAVERAVRRFSDANRSWKNAELLDLEPTSTVEILERTRRLHQRVQDPAGHWQIDHRTTHDGLVLIFTPQAPVIGTPPIFTFPNEPYAAHAQEALTRVVEFGGDVVIAGHYLTPAAENSPSWAQVLGLTGPDDEVVISTRQAKLDPTTRFHLAVVAQSGIVRNRLAMHPGSVWSGQRGFRIHLQDPSGTFTAQMLIQIEDGRVAVATDLTAHPLVGRFPYEMRSTLDIFRDAEPTDSIEIRLNDTSVGDPVDADQVTLGQILTGYRRDAGIIAALDRVQAHVGERFPLPDCIGAAERDDIVKAARLLEGRTIRMPGMVFTATVFADRVHDFLEQIREQPGGDLVITDAGYQFDCGQHRLDLGRVTVRLPRAVIANLDQINTVIGSGTDVPVKFRASDDQGAEVRLMEFNGQDLTLPIR